MEKEKTYKPYVFVPHCVWPLIPDIPKDESSDNKRDEVISMFRNLYKKTGLKFINMTERVK